MSGKCQNNSSVSLRVYLLPVGVTYQKEVLVFDGLDMVANVGGYLGLLLGWSCLTIFEAASNKFAKT